MNDRKFAIFMGVALVSWYSKKQCSVATSIESEYNVLVDAAAEMSWSQSLLLELGIIIPKAPLSLCDNIGSAYLSINPVLHAHMKRVEIDFHLCVTKSKVLVSDPDLVSPFFRDELLAPVRHRV
ncbi:hypothetical protein BC332_15210 [Capsicum chinense]|nr:hypothetical protein BC332_15210 [Capsicum chinense]